MAAFMNPGTVDKAEGLEFSKLVEKSDPNTLCPHCETSYTKDSRHCYICNQCVHRFDHHCQWINNCVGRNNHCVFYGYITTLLAYFVRMIIMCYSHINVELSKDDFKHVSYNPFGDDLLPLKIERFYTNLESIDQAQTMMYITLLEVMLISIIFLVPLSYLVYI